VLESLNSFFGNIYMWKKIVDVYVFGVVVIKLMLGFLYTLDLTLHLPRIHLWRERFERVFLVSVGFLLLVVFWPLQKMVEITPTERYVFFLLGCLLILEFTRRNYMTLM
jgi:hypothetical protein